MSDNSMKELIIFYAWQSDLPDNTNRTVIRQALQDARSRLEDEFSQKRINIILDEATRNEPGSPNIPTTILEKITAADIFVCDVTTVNSGSPNPMPNPNVVFELGYAVSQIGWGRVVMLFNKKFGNFPNDMPFDFDRHRASPYSFAPPKDKKVKKNEIVALRKPLVEMLCSAFKAIIEKNPQKPFLTKKTTDKQQKKIRDVANLKWLMSKVHIPTIEMHIEELPHKIYDRIFFFWEDFNAVALSGLFYLYDKEAQKLVTKVREAWGGTLSFGHQYHSGHSNVSFFSNPMDMPLSVEQQKDWDTINEFRKRLNKEFRKLLIRIRVNYFEIDITDLSKKAWDAYVEDKKELVEELSRRETK